MHHLLCIVACTYRQAHTHLFDGIVGALEGLDSADVVVWIPLLILELGAIQDSKAVEVAAGHAWR